MMEILPVKDFGVLHNLGKMLYRVGRHDESRGYLSQAFEVQPSVVFDDLIEYLRNINQDEAINLFAREISKVDSLVEGTMHDSLVRKDAISLREKLFAFLIKCNRPSQAIEVAEEAIYLIESYVSKGKVTRLWMLQKQRLLLSLSREFMKKGHISSAKTLLRYRTHDPQLTSLSLRENVFILLIAPTFSFGKLF